MSLMIREFSSSFVSRANRLFVEKLRDTVKRRGFQALDGNMYVTTPVLKDFAKVCCSLQFLVMIEKGDHFELKDAAFGQPPRPKVKAGFVSYPSETKKLIVLRHRKDRWDLIRPVKGHEETFR